MQTGIRSYVQDRAELEKRFPRFGGKLGLRRFLDLFRVRATGELVPNYSFLRSIVPAIIGAAFMCGTGCHRRASSPVTGLYVNTVGGHPSILVVLPDRRYVHCVYRKRLRRYISQVGRWNWYILKGHRRRLSFDGFVFYPGDHAGYPPGIDSGQPGYWAVHVGRDRNGRARLCLDVDGYDRYFVWHLSAGWIGPLVTELIRRPMPTRTKRKATE